MIRSKNVRKFVETYMQVYPTAGLIRYVRKGVLVFLVNPNDVSAPGNVIVIKEKASIGMEVLREKLLSRP